MYHCTIGPWHKTPDFLACEDRWHRPAYASAQSDQRLYCSLPGKNNAPTYTKHFNIQASICSLACSFEQYSVKNITFILTRDMASMMKFYCTAVQLGPNARKHYFVACEQLKRRPACASAQSDLQLSFRSVETYYTQNYFNILASPCADLEAGTGGPDPLPPEKSQNIGCLSNAGQDPLEKHKTTKPAFNVGLPSARQRNAIKMSFRWWADDEPTFSVSWILCLTSSKHVVSGWIHCILCGLEGLFEHCLVENIAYRLTRNMPSIMLA